MSSPRLGAEFLVRVDEDISRSADCLRGGGETGAQMRAIDWSDSPLGPVGSWPWSLRTTVGTLLACPAPLVVWWGPDLVFLCNDAWVALTGERRPRALGRPGGEVWPEIWALLGPTLEGVRSSGEAVTSENGAGPVHRGGFADEVRLRYSYSPIRDESGEVGGVFTTVHERAARGREVPREGVTRPGPSSTRWRSNATDCGRSSRTHRR